MIVKVRYINLVNIMENRMVSTELIQHAAAPETIMNEVDRILTDDSYRSGMLETFRSVRARFEGKHASRRVSEIIGTLAGWR